MKTLTKWVIVAFFELIICFLLLDSAASFVSSKSNTKVALGVVFYLSSLVIIPVSSVSYIIREISDAKNCKRELKQAFPQEKFSLIKLLDRKR